LTFGIVPLMEQVVGDVRRTLYLLLGAVGFVLLIACANVANLQLSRTAARQKEIAVRSALGATRARVISQLLTESVSLALCGGVLGLLLAYTAIHWIRILGPQSVPRLSDISIDLTALLFTFTISVASAILFGLAPAGRASAIDIQNTLQDTSRTSAGVGALWGRGRGLRHLLVVAELALCTMLLIGAALLIRSFQRAKDVPPGFNPQNVLTLELTMSGSKYKDKQAVWNVYHQLWQRLESLPGVAAAGAVTSLPLSQMYAWGPITVEGRVPPAGEKFINADTRMVSGDYFQAMGIPLLSGRLFNEHDVPANPGVAIVDAHMAEELWPGQDAVGKRIHIGGIDDTKAPWITVVGVVGRVKQYTLDSDSRIAFYLPHTQYPTRAMNVVLRSGTDPATMAAAVREQIRQIDSDLPLYNVVTMEHRVDLSLARRRFAMLLLGCFAIISLTLAAIGIYGVLAYLVSQGTREIGIRMALGASRAAILRLVVSRGIMLAVGGVVIGIAGAFLLTHLMRTLLFGVAPTDPVTFCAIPLLLFLISLLATAIPARRAAQVDPAECLRYD
jgi:predicted permease